MRGLNKVGVSGKGLWTTERASRGAEDAVAIPWRLLRHRVPRNDIPRWGNKRADESMPEPYILTFVGTSAIPNYS
jgi:hypothetical protein